MRQDPFGNQQQGVRRRRRFGGLRWWVLLLFAGYAAWYWFSNRSVDPYTGETVLIDENITPQDEKALGLQAYQQILAQEPPIDDDAEISRQVSEIARRSFVSESTVRTQVKSVLGKLQVNSQLTAVGLAYRARWRAPGAHGTGDWNGSASA